MDSQQEKDDQKTSENSTTTVTKTIDNLDVNKIRNMFKNSLGIFTVIILWSLAGIVAFIISIYCFTKSGTTAEKVIGLLISVILGPLYFIYAALNEKYCK